MAVKVINPNKLKKVLSVASADKALEDVAKTIQNKLLENIDKDYLNRYEPKQYKRTTNPDILKDNAHIGKPYYENRKRKINIGLLEGNESLYPNKFPVEYAWANMSKGFHGSNRPNVPYILTDDMITKPSPLETTQDWIDENATELLKKSLQSQGYNIK